MVLLVSNWVKWHGAMSAIGLIRVLKALPHRHKVFVPWTHGWARIINPDVNHIRGLPPHRGWERRKTTLEATGVAPGWGTLLHASVYISGKFPEQETKWCWRLRSCSGCLQDVWFILVMYPQLSASRKSCRKYVILLKNKQGTLKSPLLAQSRK